MKYVCYKIYHFYNFKISISKASLDANREYYNFGKYGYKRRDLRYNRLALILSFNPKLQGLGKFAKIYNYLIPFGKIHFLLSNIGIGTYQPYF